MKKQKLSPFDKWFVKWINKTYPGDILPRRIGFSTLIEACKEAFEAGKKNETRDKIL